MFVVKMVNESEYKGMPVYLREKDLANGLIYCCDEEKNGGEYFDIGEARVCGCSDTFCHGDVKNQMETVYDLIVGLNSIYRTDRKPMLKHRVVSFEESDLLSIEELAFIAERITDWYALLGFPGFYGVHLNTENPHIHLQIGSVCYYDGNRMHIDFEKIMLAKLTGYWYRLFYLNLLNNPDELKLRLEKGWSEHAVSVPEATEMLQKNISWIESQFRIFVNTPRVFPEGFIYDF